MSESIPERADARQLRIQAKELLRRLQSGDDRFDDIPPERVKLADAQRALARKYGFPSWPKLVDQVETPALMGRFKEAVEKGDVEGLDRLLRTKPSVRARINEPLFSFDAPAIVWVSHQPQAVAILPVLVRYGADPNIRTTWWAGGFGALDHARGEAAEILVRLGAKYDVWSAAVHGQIDVLRELLERDPSSVNAAGGDGGTPLHFAGNAEVAEFLIERGAELERRDVDHEGTPIQHHIREPEIVRVLLRHGAKPDIFTAVALDDAELASRILEEDPTAVDASVGLGVFATHQSNGGHIYAYKIGPTMTPHALAAKLGHRAVLEVLLRSATPARRVVAAAWMEDAAGVEAVLAAYPGIGGALGAEARAIADAAQQGKTETVRLLLAAGVDPTTPGLDGGSALHIACWFGYVDVVRLLVGRVPLSLKDATHGSVPLGWAAHGAQWCRNKAGDYVGVVEVLLAAGADVDVPGNSQGKTMLEQAGAREDVKEVLRRYGAR